jgi:amino acid adenylation domain-containing protein
MMQDVQQEPIAIIGIGCRFPGAEDPLAFWKLLSEGRDAVREVPADRWKIEKLYDPDPSKPGKMRSRWGGFLDQIDQFDWRLFRIPPREARYMDPQHRLLLEVAWEALEDAGLPLEQVAGSQTSVAIGVGWSDYMRMQSRNWSQIDGYTATGSASSFAANRLSYVFDLKGPSVSLDAGCSSSLVAVHYACQSLWMGEATLALAGGVNVMVTPDGTIMVSKAGLLSPDGLCKTLDSSADGFVRGEGAGVIVLKRLSDVQPEDRVYALIHSVAVNHNGHNEWIIASSQPAQEALLREAYRKAGVEPADVDYVELHGTGFARGDAVETKALGAIVGRDAARKQACMIGSVKTNLGHLEAAAGIAGIIKVALSLYYHQIPPSLNLVTLNPAIALDDWQLAVPRSLCPWPEKQGPSYAGVTALAFAGVNAHAVLSVLPPQSAEKPDECAEDSLHILPVSARSEDALYAQVAALRDFLHSSQFTTPAWSDICYTASVCRTHHDHRLAVVARSSQEAATALDTLIKEHQGSHNGESKQAHKQVFLFAHQLSGSLVESYPFLCKQVAFRAVIDECDQLFRRYAGQSIWEEIRALVNSHHKKGLASPPVCFTWQLALAALWSSWGIVPDAVVGEGFGEIAAARVAGLLTIEEAIQLIVHFMHREVAPKKRTHVNGTITVEQQPIKILPPGKGLTAATPFYSVIRGRISDPRLLLEKQWEELATLPDLSVATIDHILTENYDVFIELGLPSALSGAIFARLQHKDQPGTVMSSMRQGYEGAAVLLEALSTLYTLGYTLEWSALYQGKGHCVTLPPYAWQRERLWIDGFDVETISTPPENASVSSLVQNSEVEEALAEVAEFQLPLEQTLASSWAKVLGLDDVGLDDNFFELGGHSLLAAQLIAQIRNAFQVEILLAELFQAPTPASCAQLVNSKIAEAATIASPAFSTIEPDPASRYLPFSMTDVQQAYWIGREAGFEGGNVGNHGYIEVEADGIDLQRLTHSIRKLVERHEMLRAVLLPDGQQQILAHVPPFQITVIDLRGQDAQTVLAQLEHIRAVLDHQMIPVGQWPAFRIYVTRFDDQRDRLYLSVESLFIDAWSMNLLIQECLRFYHEPATSLPELKLSFRDYIVAEAALHTTEWYKRSEEYWLKRISTLPSAPELPLRSSTESPPLPRFVHRMERLRKEEWQRLKVRAARIGLTPSGILLAAFAEVLTVWSKSPRFSINLSTFNRLPLHPQVNDIVGDFTSLLVLAVDNAGSESFETRAQRLQAQLWSDLDHSHYSGIQVLRELARAQGSVIKAVMPIVFTSLLIQDTAHPCPPPWQETVYCVSQTPQVWLDHQVLETNGELVFHWESVDSVFPDGMIDAMFSSYCQLLQRLACCEESWQGVNHLVPAEQLAQRILCNATEAQVSEELLHTLFNAQVMQNPERIAVITDQKSLTYQEIYTGSLLLGWQLRHLGMRPNQLVAVVMEKGWEQVVAVLGILQAGAAYLPIDPTLPHERQMYLLEHGHVEVVLTQSWLDGREQWPQQLHRICVDSLDLHSKGISPLEPVQLPEDLAYVIYTSGSTGLPKGVMIDHRGAVNTILDVNQRFEVGDRDRIFALSALNFDLSVYDIFGMLAAGGAIVIPPEGTMRNPEAWSDMLERGQVTIWNSVPALLQMFVEYTEGQPEVLQCSSLRLALLSGDWIPLSLPERIKKMLPDVEVISLGGATEASIWSILYPIEAIDSSWKSIPYGRPMRNQRFAVLNERYEPCPIWVPGQLYISGIGLAKGYWRDEQKTQASFLLHPLTGERLYRTGDLGRYLPDGNIEFLGREDFQVKVQGHRIELGEIEETLLQHPMVAGAVATAVTGPRGDKNLVAYVTLQPAQEQTTSSSISNDLQPLQAASNGTSTRSFSLSQLTGQLPVDSVEAVSPGKGISNGALQRLEAQFGRKSMRTDTDKPIIQIAHAPVDARTLARYRARQSHRTFLLEPVPFDHLCNFLGVLRQIELDGLPKYLYPSAGSIYPVQCYLYIKAGRVEKMPEGIYYYHPEAHRLHLLSANAQVNSAMHGDINQPIFEASAFSLFFIGKADAISPLYGEAARDFMLLEAGYMSQLLMMLAPEYQLGCCPIGGCDFEAIRDFFDLEQSHVLLHSLLCGPVDPIASPGRSFLPADASISVTEHIPGQVEMQAVTSGDMLRNFLKEKLPQYMVPSTIMVLEALPLTANGKVDRKHLPVPEVVSPQVSNRYIAPETQLEQAIAAVWQEFLPSAKVGVHDNFFDLGGNSLLMVQTYTRLRKLLDRDISITDMFFQYSTIHALAAFVTQKQAVPLATEEDTDRLESRKKLKQQQRQSRLKHRFMRATESEGE